MVCDTQELHEAQQTGQGHDQSASRALTDATANPQPTWLSRTLRRRRFHYNFTAVGEVPGTLDHEQYLPLILFKLHEIW